MVPRVSIIAARLKESIFETGSFALFERNLIMEQTMTGMDFKIREVAGRIRELREISGFTVEEMAGAPT